MIAYYDIIKHDLHNLNLMTEFLEACNWDNEFMNSQLEIVREVLNSMDPSSNFTDFSSLLEATIFPNLVAQGLSMQQATIVKNIILNRKEEYLELLQAQEE